METKAKKLCEAAKLAKQVEEFKARGGEVNKLSYNLYRPLKPARAVGTNL